MAIGHFTQYVFKDPFAHITANKDFSNNSISTPVTNQSSGSHNYSFTNLDTFNPFAMFTNKLSSSTSSPQAFSSLSNSNSTQINPIVTPGQNFNGKVSFNRLLHEQGKEALQSHIEQQITSLGKNLNQFEGKTFTIANREYNVGNAEGLKQASGKYNDEMVVVKVQNGKIQLLTDKVFDVATTPDILDNDWHRSDRALVPTGQIEAFRAKSHNYKGEERIAFQMVNGWDEVHRINEDSGTTNRLDTKDNATCIFHTGEHGAAGGQGCIVFKSEDQNQINQLVTASKGGTFNMLVLDSNASSNTTMKTLA